MYGKIHACKYVIGNNRTERSELSVVIEMYDRYFEIVIEFIKKILK